MREIQVPGGEPPNNRPAQRWSVEMDEFDAVRELREHYGDSVEEVLDFVRGDNREVILRNARTIIVRLQPEFFTEEEGDESA